MGKKVKFDKRPTTIEPLYKSRKHYLKLIEKHTAELEHDSLWRTTRCLPERGQIGIFNRSYYEEILIVRVQPKILKSAALLSGVLQSQDFWQERYRSIVELEGHPHRNGTRIIQSFLHLSKEEQRKRFLSRIDEADKNWKFSMADIEQRKYWRNYQVVYEACLGATSTDSSPWYAVPADHKQNAHLIISRIILTALRELRMSYPEPDATRLRELPLIRKWPQK